MRKPKFYTDLNKRKRYSVIVNDFVIHMSRREKMAFQYEEPFDLQKIQETLGISPQKILSVLNNELAEKVHSVRGRVKDSNHLIGKIIRNKSDKPKKYEALNIDNYNKIITDLIGFRIIILDKKDWRDVHNTLLKVFQNIPERYAVKDDDLVKFLDIYAPNKKCKDFFSV